MTIIEMRTMQIICSTLPEIAKQLKRIADSHETTKGNDNDEATAD